MDNPTPPSVLQEVPQQASSNPAVFSQTKKFSFKKLLFRIFLILFLLITLAIGIYMFLATPFQAYGNLVKPFVEGQLVFAEQVSYLFQKPKIGDRVTFQSALNKYNAPLVGIIIDIKTDNGIEKYNIRSSTKGEPWTVTKNEIKKKIYYPFLDTTEAQAIVAELNQPTPTQIPSSPTPDPTANWKTYNSAKFGYSINFPDTLKYSTRTYNGIGGVVTIDEWSTLGTGGYSIQILSYKEGINTQLEFNLPPKPEGEIIVANQIVKKIESQDGLLVHIGPLKKSQQEYIIIYTSTSQKAEATNFYQILSTFKFLEKTTDNGTSIPAPTLCPLVAFPDGHVSHSCK